MERFCYVFEIVEGFEEEYDRMHHHIWPELAAAIRDAGYRDYTLFRRGTQVVCTTKCVPDVATAQARMRERHSEISAKWERAMGPFIERMYDSSGDLFVYPECWHLEDDAP